MILKIKHHAKMLKPVRLNPRRVFLFLIPIFSISCAQIPKPTVIDEFQNGGVIRTFQGQDQAQREKLRQFCSGDFFYTNKKSDGQRIFGDFFLGSFVVNYVDQGFKCGEGEDFSE